MWSRDTEWKEEGGIPKAFRGFRRRDPQTTQLRSHNQMPSRLFVYVCVSVCGGVKIKMVPDVDADVNCYLCG